MAGSDRLRTLRTIGAALWVLGVLAGGALLLFFDVIEAFSAREPGAVFVNMAVAAMLAFPACLVYLLIPVLIDRYDPEPWWALTLVFVWGAVASCGFAMLINTVNGELVSAVSGSKAAGNVFGAVVSAPLVEEFFKGLALLGVFVFLRQEFDGMVDGVIYATFTALGFAAMENVSYYARGAGHGILPELIFVRGFLSAWIHPLFTSMTGLGFGLARESSKTWVRYCAPVGGYLLAVGLHATWNGLGFLFSQGGILGILVQVALWLPFVLLFGMLLLYLVAREGRTIRKFLVDEVLLGNLTQQEVDLVCSPFGRVRAMFTKGGFKGRRFVDAASRLALSKWHATNAMQGQKRTISVEFIVPLRQELHALRAQIQAGHR